jgi:hypothetical protein
MAAKKQKSTGGWLGLLSPFWATVFLLVIQNIHNKPKFALIVLRLVLIPPQKSEVYGSFPAWRKLPLAFYIAVVR